MTQSPRLPVLSRIHSGRASRGKSAPVAAAFVAATGMLLAGATAQAGGDCPAIDRRIDDRIIVHLADGVAIESFTELFTSRHPTVGLTVDDQVPGRPIYQLDLALPSGYTEAFLDGLEFDLETGYIGTLRTSDNCDAGKTETGGDWLYVSEATEGKSGHTFVDGLLPSQYIGQYAGGLLDLPLAQTRSTGQTTVVAILDTGVDLTHPSLQPRLAGIGPDFIDLDGNPQDDGNGIDDDGDMDVDEMVGHGTFVAGIVAYAAPDALLYPIRVLNSDGIGDAWTVTRGLYAAIDRGVEVINMSLSSDYDSQVVKLAIVEAATLGIVVVAPAGNAGFDCPREFPAMDDVCVPEMGTEILGALGVAALDSADRKAGFSNYDRRLALSAPGAHTGSERIVSTLPGDDYGAWEGTSFAVPFVAATAALVRSQHPEWVADLSTYDSVNLVLLTTSVDIYAIPENLPYAEDQELGRGRIDPAAAVAAGPVAPGTGDLNADGVVSFADLLVLLADWGQVHSAADLDGSGRVDTGDLIALLSNWG